jgi:PqqD family protein of HPr-rel-A system
VQPSALLAPSRGVLFRQRDDLSVSHLDGETYLADARSGAIHHLDAIATAIWHLLSEPADVGQLAEELAGAFPDVPPTQIADDVAALLADLEARGLIVSV